jgi:hypothetical protein
MIMSQVIFLDNKSILDNLVLNFIKLVILMTATLAVSIPLTVQAGTVCGPEVKEELAKLLSETLTFPEKEKMAMQADLYEQYKYCAEENQQQRTGLPIIKKPFIGVETAVDSNNLLSGYTDYWFHRAAQQCGAKVSQKGSLYYEEMSCCGYDPQRRQFACPVKIKQPFGFGGAPLPGSREYVLHCVADASGMLVPVGRDSVHLANEMHNSTPTWQFAVIANANSNLQTIYPMNGATRRARSILSWGFEPTSCDFQPIWGNALNYHIRLDQ